MSMLYQQRSHSTNTTLDDSVRFFNLLFNEESGVLAVSSLYVFNLNMAFLNHFLNGSDVDKITP